MNAEVVSSLGSTPPARAWTVLTTIAAPLIFFAVAAPAAHAQAAPDFKCVVRVDSVRPPPRSLPSLLQRRHEKDDDDHDRSEAARSDRGSDSDMSRPATSTLNFAPVCPDGQVPVSTRPIYDGLKGNPLFASDPANEIFSAADRKQFVREHVRSFDEVYGNNREEPPPPPGPPGTNPACDGTWWYGACFYYGAAAFSRVADGAGMTQSIERPAYVNTAGPMKHGHTLNEIAVMDSSSIFNTVELGWFLSSDVYADADPHIFVYHWIQGQQTCYDKCGWQQWSNTYHPGLNLGAAVGKQVYIGYVFFEGNWWAWFDDQWMGYFPGSIWNGAFSKTKLIQWFGEVESLNGIPPQTQMGNGQFPASPGAASMITLCDVDAVAWVCWYRDLQSLAQTPPNPKDYDIGHTGFGATRYGGPGQ
jgi:Neprosin